MASRYGVFSMKTVLCALALSLATITAYAQNSELAGICKQENTSARCQFTNNSSAKVVGISWLLAGSEVDYVGETEVSLSSGQSIEISNNRGRDNCLFTQDTSIFVTWDSDATKAYHGKLRFDSEGQCFMNIGD